MNTTSGGIHGYQIPTTVMFEYYTLRAPGEVELYPHALSIWPLERGEILISCPRRCISGTKSSSAHRLGVWVDP